VFLLQKKPNAALRDAEAALAINPDSGKARKIRGKAYALLGEWKKAVDDLKVADQVDFDPETRKLLNKCVEKYGKLEERERAKQRKAEDKERRRREAEAAWMVHTNAHTHCLSS
jgi:suppressor of tumorigenicity protein 13